MGDLSSDLVRFCSGSMDAANAMQAKVKEQKSNIAKVLNLCLAVGGILVLATGVMGFYWGVKVVLKVGAWPLMNCNGLISGFFMLIFGISLVALTLFGKEEVTTWGKFLDTFWGRGFFCLYLGGRIMPMGQWFCMIGGICMVLFGIAQIVVQFVFFEKPGYCMTEGVDKNHNDELVSSVIDSGGLYQAVPGAPSIPGLSGAA